MYEQYGTLFFISSNSQQYLFCKYLKFSGSIVLQQSTPFGSSTHGSGGVQGGKSPQSQVLPSHGSQGGKSPQSQVLPSQASFIPPKIVYHLSCL